MAHLENVSRKRKKPDEDPILTREGPLTEPPIENEYEHLDEDDEAEDDRANNLGRLEFEKVKQAQEKATINQYDNIKVTPFNLEEELEEGQFDRAGNFIFKKKKDDSDEDSDESTGTAEPDEVDPVTTERRDLVSCYKDMLRIMQPDETVKRTIQRLGKESKGNAPASQRLDRIIELAHQRLEEGDMNIYQKTYDDLENFINH